MKKILVGGAAAVALIFGAQLAAGAFMGVGPGWGGGFVRAVVPHGADEPRQSVDVGADRYLRALKEEDRQYLHAHSVTAVDSEVGVGKEVETLLACRDWSRATVSTALSDISPDFATAVVHIAGATGESVTIELNITSEPDNVPEGDWAVFLPTPSCP